MSADRPAVDILIATYNGEAWISDQLDSLLQQTFTDWRILARDDASTDGTVAVLEDFAARYPQRLTIQRNEQNLGVMATFNLLLVEAAADRIMLCDQDDIWLPEKIEKTLQRFDELEGRYGRETPLLLHTDLRVVDQDLSLVAASLWRYQKCDPEGGRRLNRLLLQNAATGCTMAINRSLRDLALPIPAEARMHDWWLALTAAAFGRIEVLPESTVLYRQHGANVAGAHRWGVGQALGLIGNLAEVRRILAVNRLQGAAFLERFHRRLPPSERAMVEAYATLGRQGFLQRRRTILKYGFSFAGLVRNLGLWLLV